jgi:hypothetical protein
MLEVTSLVAETFSRAQAEEFRRAYGPEAGVLAEIIDGSSRAALERIGNSDALTTASSIRCSLPSVAGTPCAA